MTTDKIYLVGFMASGKSTIARALAARLRWRAEDIDDLIEARERTHDQRTSSRKHGEPYFRIVEREILGILRPIRHARRRHRRRHVRRTRQPRAINLDGVSVWIDVPLADLIPRIPLDGRRPLAADRAQLERLYNARVEAYRLAHVRVARVAHVGLGRGRSHSRGDRGAARTVGPFQGPTVPETVEP